MQQPKSVWGCLFRVRIQLKIGKGVVPPHVQAEEG